MQQKQLQSFVPDLFCLRAPPTPTYQRPTTTSPPALSIINLQLQFVMESLICWILREADYAYFSFGQWEMEPGVWQQQSVQV